MVGGEPRCVGRNDVPPRDRVVRRWGRTDRSIRGQSGGRTRRGHRSRLLTRVVIGLASLAVLSAPASVLTAARRPAATSADAAARLRSDEGDAARRQLDAAFDDQPAAPTGDETAIEPPPAEFDAPAGPTAPPPAALTAPAIARQGGVWAVVIGIDDYPGRRSDLRASVADANEMDLALARYGVPGDRRLVLRNTQASASTIADSLRWLVAHASSDSTVVFFYAGHVRKLSSRTEAIVAADGRLVTDATMASLLAPLASHKVWIAMASCYGGGFDEVLAPGRILTGAADANSLAYESSTYGHSYLVEYMVKRAMNEGRAPDSIEQSFAWAAAALRREHPDRVPVEVDDLPGQLALGPTAARATAPPPPAPAPGDGSGSRGGGGSTPPPDPGKDPGHENDCVITVGTLVRCGS